MKKSLVLLMVSLLTAIAFIAYAQKQPFPDDWAKEAGPKPEEVPEVDERGATNVALLPITKPNASSTIAGYEDRHSVEFLNDGWYNNPRCWICASMPAWAEIDLGKIYKVDKVVFGSEHTAEWEDRAITEFRILVATKYNEDSGAATWKEVFNYEGDPVRDTTPFTFDPVQARWVRVDILAGEAQPRIDELEVYATPGSTAVTIKQKLTTTWGQIKK